jgi:hypothetical protein
MKRAEFIKIAINDPKKGAEILRTQAKELEGCKKVMRVAETLSKTLFISDRTVFRDCKK